ncbi:MAG TPA: glycosyltransferase family 39 protein [Pseudonocardiaceae bacterium]|jgi:4-amino-4-deoxy-L-arabinose transferase-like glycosyltransferase|nr:glycosyltransferase family 39 protein [Pseudonocardiaceae bacterium]
MTAALPLTVSHRWSRPQRFGAWLSVHASGVAISAVVLNLILAGGYAIHLGRIVRFHDEQVYLDIVGSLAYNHGFTVDSVNPTAYRPPGYAFLLLPLHLASGGSVVVLRMAGVLALAGTVWFTYLLGRRAHTPATGAIAAVVVACYPLLIFTATTLYPQVPALFLLLVTFEMAARALPENGRAKIGYALLAGLVGGFLIITVPTFGVTAVVLVAWLAWRRFANRRKVSWAAVLALILALAVLPGVWCVRNAVVMRAFVPVSTNDGFNLLLGNSPNTTADSGTDVDISRYTTFASVHQYNEVQADHYFAGQALSWIGHHPGSAAELYAEKVVNNFSYSDDLATSSQGSVLQNVVSAASYYPILLLALVRLLMYRRWRLSPTEKLLALTIVVNILLLAVFFTRIRFRVPLDALTVVLAASTLSHLLNRRRVRQRKAVA